MGTAVWVLMMLSAMLAANAERNGVSLRGALEALQRRQRGQLRPAVDYEPAYDLVPQPYQDSDYPIEIEELNGQTPNKYVLQLLDRKEITPDASYEYKIIKKKNGVNYFGKKESSAFRERTHHPEKDILHELFEDGNDVEDTNDQPQSKNKNDADYAYLLTQLWSKYKNNKSRQRNPEAAPQGVLKMYKEKVVKKSYPDSWGPIAFKRKRSPDANMENKPLNPDPAYKYDTISDGEDDDDMQEEYTIAMEPLEGEPVIDLTGDAQYPEEIYGKPFPVSKRSSTSLDHDNSLQNQNKRDTMKQFRSNSGTDPRILKDLSKIFGDADEQIIKNPVKRSSGSDDDFPPQIAVQKAHNHTHLSHNESHHKDDPDSRSHEQHHGMHHPGITGEEVEHPQHDHNKPKIIRKKSIDWSDYFGIDKRNKKYFIKDDEQDTLRKQYFNTFNKEVIRPFNSYHGHSKIKRNYVSVKLNNEDTQPKINSGHTAVAQDNGKRSDINEKETKLDKIDKNLKNMEGLLVEEALHYANADEQLDSKEEQEMKEKLLSQLAAAYSLEKMRKALKDFKQNLQSHKSEVNMPAQTPTDDGKTKRIAIKKELTNNDIPLFNKVSDDFESEQGAGHYLNGKMDEQFSEGYMGSGSHRTPFLGPVSAASQCPILSKIVQRCHSVDILAGDRGQLFLPLCSLHQICYLCGETPPTTCDLVFLSEADTACEGDASCQRKARSTLMGLRDLHDNLLDELDGECTNSPCLPAMLQLNNWQQLPNKR